MSQEIEIQALYSSLRSRQPQLVKKREILLDGSEDLILSLYTKGMSVRDIQLY
jgi:transposase-like protein